MTSLAEPIPVSYHLVIVGGDPCLSESEAAWNSCWRVVNKFFTSYAPAGCLVLYGALAGSPDVMASAVASWGHFGLRHDDDGLVRSKAQGHRVCGTWSDAPCPEALPGALAQRAALASREGWGVDVLVLHGFGGSHRGEFLAEAMEHLGVGCRQWDISRDGEIHKRQA